VKEKTELDILDTDSLVSGPKGIKKNMSTFDSHVIT